MAAHEAEKAARKALEDARAEKAEATRIYAESMSRYRVGDRVRVVRGWTRSNIGKVGVVKRHSLWIDTDPQLHLAMLKKDGTESKRDLFETPESSVEPESGP